MAALSDRPQYFATGRYWGSDIGLNNTIPDRQAIHDNTAQARGFAYMSTLLDPETRVSTIFGAWKAKFQIPNTPGNFPAFPVANTGPSPQNNSATLNENQYESNVVGVMAWQRSTLQYDAQLAYFTRYNSVNFKPDTQGDIVFNGIASNVFRGAFVNGVQGDAAYRLNELHTLRAGFISSGETTNVNSTNGVLGMDPDTGDTTTNPFTIIDPVSKVGWIAGFYLQDEWKLTDQLTLNYGFRFDQMWQFVNTNQLSPRVNLVYRPWEGSNIHAGYARYFTPPVQALAGPTNTLAFINTTNQPEVLQNSPVLPERSHVFDVGATQQFGGFLSGLEIGVDGYYKIARDLIDDGQFGAAYVLPRSTTRRAKTTASSGLRSTGMGRSASTAIWPGRSSAQPTSCRTSSCSARMNSPSSPTAGSSPTTPRPIRPLAAWPMSGTAPVSAPT